MATYHFHEESNAKEAFHLFRESINKINEYNRLCKEVSGSSNKFHVLGVHIHTNYILSTIKEIEASGIAFEGMDDYRVLYTDKTVLGDIFVKCKNHCFLVDYIYITAIEDTVQTGCFAQLAKDELLEINKKVTIN